MLILILAFFGLCLGSFVNALVWRTRQQERMENRVSRIGNKNKKLPIPNSQFSILRGRSMCPHCGHELAAADLVPVLSWLWLRGRCRYCKKPISVQYPLVELIAGSIFVLSYIFWPNDFNTGQWVLFITWLLSGVGLLALAIYDLKWMLLPNRIIYPTLLVAAVGRLIYLLGFQPHKPDALFNWVLSLLVAAGLFFVLYMMSNGRWIGYGDVRLGLITGTLLLTPAKSFLMIFAASVLGLIVALPLIATGRRQLSSKLPFGPFLIVATFICVLFGASFINWYKGLVGL